MHYLQGNLSVFKDYKLRRHKKKHAAKFAYQGILHEGKTAELKKVCHINRNFNVKTQIDR